MSFAIVHRAGPYKVRARKDPSYFGKRARLMYWVEGPGTDGLPAPQSEFECRQRHKNAIWPDKNAAIGLAEMMHVAYLNGREAIPA